MDMPGGLPGVDGDKRNTIVFPLAYDVIVQILRGRFE